MGFMALEELFSGYLMVLTSIPLTLLVGLTGLKVYSWGRQLLLEREKELSVQTD